MKSTTLFVSTSLTSLLVLCTACSDDSTSTGGASGQGGTAAGGASASGGTTTTSSGTATGGFVSTTGGISGGGITAAGGAPTGGVAATGGGTATTGGTTSAGGAGVTGGTTGAGGATVAGGATNVGGNTASGGGAVTGGRTGRGGGTGVGGSGVGGSTDVGGSTNVGGSTDVGGSGTTGGSTGVAGGTGVTVQLAQTKQTIQGFGINTALYSGSVPISTMFSTTGADGIGLSILRVGMNTDGSLTGSGISEAKAAGAKIIGSCWSAPADCKSNKSTKDGGYLLTPDSGSSCYESWATTIANFASQQGLYAMSIANESDFASCPGNPVCTDSYETMTYTAKQMVEFVKVAGPKLKAKNIKVIAPECSEWLHLWSTLSATGSIVSSHPDSSDPHKCGCFSNTITADAEAKCTQACKDGDGYDYGHWLWKDQEAWKAFDIFGVHEYDSQIAYQWPADVNEGKRDREIWQTEMSGVMHWPEQGPSTDIANGIAVAGWIHSAFTVGEASAWLYWWYQALYQDDNEGLAKLKSAGTTAKRYYTLGNYSKFVRPGYLAVDVTGNSDANVLLSAYKDPAGGTVVIVAINKGSAAAEVPITIAGGTAPTSCTPTVTSANDNLKDGTAVSVAAGVLTASLASKTVTTYVCK
jgi:glucuronoarabinoxylan endo-1,4-beta-xylanase